MTSTQCTAASAHDSQDEEGGSCLDSDFNEASLENQGEEALPCSQKMFVFYLKNMLAFFCYLFVQVFNP